MNLDFINDVKKGLESSPKTLPSKYFYDEIGDQLFVEIMNLPEYYLTRSELNIFKNKSGEIIEHLNLIPQQEFELIELGAGNGEKLITFTSSLLKHKLNFVYKPVDISLNALEMLQNNFSKAKSQVKIEPLCGDYFHMLKQNLELSKLPKVILFLGSNLGNMYDEEARDFLSLIHGHMQKNDFLILGLDLIKNEEIVLPAYNDRNGVTKRFNLNLLDRINKELSANFDLSQFIHRPKYCEKSGMATSSLLSLMVKTVSFANFDSEYLIEEGEAIHTEISRKYNDQILRELIKGTNFKVRTKIVDDQKMFANYILEKI